MELVIVRMFKVGKIEKEEGWGQNREPVSVIGLHRLEV
jgi:hypothetical protein